MFKLQPSHHRTNCSKSLTVRYQMLSLPWMNRTCIQSPDHVMPTQTPACLLSKHPHAISASNHQIASQPASQPKKHNKFIWNNHALSQCTQPPQKSFSSFPLPSPSAAARFSVACFAKRDFGCALLRITLAHMRPTDPEEAKKKEKPAMRKEWRTSQTAAPCNSPVSSCRGS